MTNAKIVFGKAHQELFLEIKEWMLRMGLEKGMEPENKLLSQRPRGFTQDFPNLVIMEGDDIDDKLSSDAKDWWLKHSPPSEPNGEIKVLITVQIYDGEKKKFIILHKWLRGQETASQTVIIESTGLPKEFDDWKTTHWVVKGAPFTIRFEDIFSRPKVGEECDFVLDEERLITLPFAWWK